MERIKAYSVSVDNALYLVVNKAKRTILECRDEGSAQHYATLLNQAYEVGYKQGYIDKAKAGLSSNP